MSVVFLQDYITRSRFRFPSTRPLQLLHVFNVSNKSSLCRNKSWEFTCLTSFPVFDCRVRPSSADVSSHVGTRKPVLFIMVLKLNKNIHKLCFWGGFFILFFVLCFVNLVLPPFFCSVTCSNYCFLLETKKKKIEPITTETDISDIIIYKYLHEFIAVIKTSLHFIWNHTCCYYCENS